MSLNKSLLVKVAESLSEMLTYKIQKNSPSRAGNSLGWGVFDLKIVRLR